MNYRNTVTVMKNIRTLNCEQDGNGHWLLFNFFFFLFFSDLPVPRRIYVCDRFQFPTHRQPHSVSGAFCACRHHLSVSGPLDFRLVIQVLLRPCMILNACVHRRHPQFNVPRGGRGNRGQVCLPRIHKVAWLGVKPTTLGL